MNVPIVAPIKSLYVLPQPALSNLFLGNIFLNTVIPLYK